MSELIEFSINGRVVRLTHKKYKQVLKRKAEIAERNRRISRELRREGSIYTNKKHARETLSGNAEPPKDLDSKQTRQKIIADMNQRRKDDLNDAWGKLFQGKSRIMEEYARKNNIPIIRFDCK